MKPCIHFFDCSGCSHHLDEKEPAIWKGVKDFFGMPVPLILENQGGWRMRARLAIRKGEGGQGSLGLFRRNSHDLIEIPHCLAHHPSINRAAALIEREMRRLQIEPYDEIRQTGSLRYAQFFVCRETGMIQLSLISREKRAAELLAKALFEIPSGWHSIWLNLHTAKSNAILGNEWICLFGEPFLRQRIGRARVSFHPASFSQAHLSLFDRLLDHIESWTAPGSRLLEVYAGAGAIALHLAPRLASALLVEENPYSHLSYLASGPLPSFDYHLGDAKEAAGYLERADLILLDPPRKGADPELLRALAASEKKQLIYISCSFDSFERDAKKLLASGWEVQDAAGFWLFPGADHIELAVHWKKNR